MGAVSRDGSVRLRVGRTPDRTTLHGFLNDVVSGDAEAIFTDSWKAYKGIGDHNTRHESVNHYREEWVVTFTRRPLKTSGRCSSAASSAATTKCP